ncbi:MAG: epoxyqueuosine reductase [Pirellulaceae bacterium]|nr:MAG: epoxyqueuosine reductase [Pirellulaceae bacterium]
MQDFTAALKRRAQQLGFSLTGVCAVATPPHYQQFLQWLDQGCAGGMRYLPDRKHAYAHPHWVLEGSRTMLMLGTPYCPDRRADEEPEPSRGQGKIARYARSDVDYHDVIHRRLKQLRRYVIERFPRAKVRGVVDTAPLLERDFAQQAGLGWFGKNTMLINKRLGSYFFLAALLTDLELVVDPPHDSAHCGTCRACLDACPTGALPQPYLLDARRCLSYWTIEHHGMVAEEMIGRLSGWVFGCDICQEVCPWNRRAPEGDPVFEVQRRGMDLLATLDMDEAAFRHQFRRTPLWRARRCGVIRNAVLLLVEQQELAAIPKLRLRLQDPDPMVRQVAAWGLARLRPPHWQQMLRQAIDAESDPTVEEFLRRLLVEPNGALPAERSSRDR